MKSIFGLVLFLHKQNKHACEFQMSKQLLYRYIFTLSAIILLKSLKFNYYTDSSLSYSNVDVFQKYYFCSCELEAGGDPQQAATYDSGCSYIKHGTTMS